MTRPRLPPTWTRAYGLLCSAVFLSYAHYSMLLVTIPLYVVHLGHSAFLAGIVLLAFSLPSFSLRPLVGLWADSWSAIGVLVIGALLISAGSALYLLPAFAAVFIASILRGLGWAGLNTGGYTVLAHLAPAQRRGEAAGYYSSITGAAQIGFPAAALWLLALPHGGYRAVFLGAALFALLSSAIGAFGLRGRAVIPRGEAAPGGGSAGFGAALGLIDRGVLLATAVNATVTLSQPAVIAFLPLYARHLGIGNIGWFYVVAGASDLLSRPLFGRAGDRVGRGFTIVPGFIAQLLGIGLILIRPSLPSILACAVLFGAGVAVTQASTMALGMDLANPLRRGAAMATFSLSFQMGNGIGSVLAGALVTLSGYRSMYVGAAVMLACGLALVFASWPKLERVTAIPLT
jgi:MFS family permease